MVAQQFYDKADDLTLLLVLFPPEIRDYLQTHSQLGSLNEIVLDVGYRPEVRFDRERVRLDELPEVTYPDIDNVVQRIGDFNSDNRAGIERTLHRISAMRNRGGRIIGLTCRIGRAISGTLELMRDIIESGDSILFLGPPGIGKTTKLREASRILSDELHKRVIVVDTSNEIAGDGDIPHPSIGSARRMQVPRDKHQHAVMIEAVENHMPEVIIVDEIGTEEEAQAARTIAERGVQLVATAHGFTLENLIKNPTLADLVGGVQTVILGDEEAKFRGTNKTVLERKTMPTFQTLVEIRKRDLFHIYLDIADSVDAYLNQDDLHPEIRHREDENEQLEIESELGDLVRQKVRSQVGSRGGDPLSEKGSVATVIDTETYSGADSVDFNRSVQQNLEDSFTKHKKDYKDIKIYPYSVNRDRIKTAIKSLGVSASICQRISDADLVLTVKTKIRAREKLDQMLKGRQLPIHVVKNTSVASITRFLRDYFHLADSPEAMQDEALHEIRDACQKVKTEQRVVEVSPQSMALRRLQHEMVARMGLNSTSIGEEPSRRVRIYPS